MNETPAALSLPFLLSPLTHTPFHPESQSQKFHKQALRPHLSALSREQLSTCLHALGRLGCVAPLVRVVDAGGGGGASLLQGLAGAVATKVGAILAAACDRSIDRSSMPHI